MRPKSIIIISWLLIIFGLMSIYSMTATQFQKDYIKIGVVFIIEWIVRIVITLVPGIAMLKGLNWGRMLYLGGMGLYMLYIIIVNIITGFEYTVISGIVVYIIFSIFLTRPIASEYFKKY